MELTRSVISAIAGLVLSAVAFTVLYGRMLFSFEQRLNILGFLILLGSIAAALYLM